MLPRRTFDINRSPFNQQLEGKRQRKRIEFRERNCVYFEAVPAFSDLPHTYLPRLHRQKTETDKHTKLGESLLKMGGYCVSNPLTKNQHLSALQREVREFTDKMRHLRKNDFDLDFRHPIVMETFPSWNSEGKVIPCILPFTVRKVKIKSLEPGYVALQLPRRDSSQYDEFCDLRADDTLHLSPKKTFQIFVKILKKTFYKESIRSERLHVVVKDNQYCILYDLLNYGWTLEIIPAIHINKSCAVLVSKPFDLDENSSSEMRWRICWGQKEEELIRSITYTDKGLRVKALHIVCKLCEKDWRLRTLTPYQIQTALLFDIDYHIDHFPRWQRCSLGECVISLLNRLLYYARIGCLPHFIIEGLDLFRLVSPKNVILYRSALERLTNNEKALISLVDCTQPEKEAETQWFKFKPEKTRRSHEQIPTITGIV